MSKVRPARITTVSRGDRRFSELTVHRTNIHTFGCSDGEGYLRLQITSLEPLQHNRCTLLVLESFHHYGLLSRLFFHVVIALYFKYFMTTLISKPALIESEIFLLLGLFIGRLDGLSVGLS